MKIVEPRKVEIKVERPDGIIEIMIHPKIDYMTDVLLKQMNNAMAEANRGKVIAYRNIDAVVEMEESDYKGRCERCGDILDTRSSYSQKEWSYFGGKKVQVAAYYCDSCHRLLTAIGAGEVTPMEEKVA